MTSRSMLAAFLEKLRNEPENIAFSDTMAIIDEMYSFKPTTFTNGDMENKAGQNTGSCKLFAFAKMNDLNVDETLSCFGTYYRLDVLEDPDGDSHQNIRNFMKSGWDGLKFEGQPLEMKY